ncbi:MAG: hypothetical protein KBT34_09140 [Prevotella sp.]|nr:hypothetical protein [Candidatus Prevotella equi]
MKAKEQAGREAAEREEAERKLQEAKREAQEAATRAKGEEMKTKLLPIENDINSIKKGEFSDCVRKILAYRRKNTSRYSLDYGIERQKLLNISMKLKDLYNQAISIVRDYDRMDLCSSYTEEIRRLDIVVNEAVGTVQVINE